MLQDFIAYLDKRISLISFKNTQKMCENLDFNPENKDFYPSSKVLKDLQNKYEYIAREKRSFL